MADPPSAITNVFLRDQLPARMGRHAVFRNHLLPISTVITIIGLIATVIAFGPKPQWYLDALPGPEWNNWTQLLGPIVLLIGVWYLVEQVYLRRRFNELIDQPKRSELQKNLPEIEDMVGRLPKSFEAKVEEKERSFKTKR